MKINLRKLRKEQGLSLKDLSVLSNINKSTLSRIENNEMIPSAMVLCKLCNALHVTLNDLVDCNGGTNDE